MKLFTLVLVMACFSAANAQKLPSIEEKTKGMERKEGFFPMYTDEEQGKLWLEISRWNTELLYSVGLPAGLGSNDIGLDRGKLLRNGIVRFEKTGRKVLMVQPNFDYRAVTQNQAEQKAVAQSFGESVVWGFVAEAATGQRVLVDATDFLVRDAGQIAITLKRSSQGTYQLDKSRSALYLPGTKNFPLNTEMEASVTFTNSDGQTGAFVRSVSPSDEAVSLRLHHSLVQLPGPGYKPREFDPRSSFINVSWYDYATPVSEPIEKRYAIRHRLEKKDKGAAISEAVEPIIYYLDPGTPEPIRSALLEGAGWWNEAFEAAGFRNAFQVKILPDSADPMDLRYNVINWVHRSTRGWSYGASVVDPRTGEIIKGHVTLGSLRVRQDYLIFSALLAPYANGVPPGDPMLQAALMRLKQLSAHEVGHTIGLMHNYASSVNDRASVMDYPHPDIRLDANGNMDFSKVYDLGIGAWDKVAINWGYREFGAGENETAGLNNILKDATGKGLQFIADRDARAAGGLHPQAHLWDNGISPVAELDNVLKVRKKALQQFGEKNVRPGMPLALLEDALVPVYFYHRYQVEAVAKLVGGMHYTYALRGDGQMPTQMLPLKEQQAALTALIGCIEPKQLGLPSAIVALIPPRPAGYDVNRELFKKRTGLSFDRLSPAETGADLVFSFLFHPERLSRLAIQQAEHGWGLETMLEALAGATFKTPRKTGFDHLIQMQTEQVMLTYLLSASVNPEASFAARASVQAALQNLKAWLEAKSKTALADKGHYLLALERMKKPEEAKPTLHREAPPGAPIGCGEDY